mmetsp:Transcript_14573/g.21965  ORF Transcript_14573/g.21965 Transcript_14573/m.21965 type:complete len:268 (+) Transcript_14573:82-885(+)
MGASASVDGISMEEFSRLKREYELKAAEGVSNEAIYDHMQSVIQTIGTSKPVVSMELLSQQHECNNCSQEIVNRATFDYLSDSNHKLCETKVKIVNALKSVLLSKGIDVTTDVSVPCPIVTPHQNFDSILVPSDHYSRRPTDVYYACDAAMLRTHLAAHLADTVKSGVLCYCMSGPVFRRLEEDTTLSELSHHLEFVRIYDGEDVENEFVSIAEEVVKASLQEPKLRWEEADEFPYVKNSLMSLETLYRDSPLEVAQGGVLSEEVSV